MKNLLTQYAIDNGIKLPDGINLPKDNTPAQAQTTYTGEKMPEDSLEFLDMYSHLKLNEDISTNGMYIREGKVNGKNTLIKSVLTEDYSDSYKIIKEGHIDNKKLLLNINGTEDSQKHYAKYKGKYNDKDIDLTVELPKEKNKVAGWFNKVIRHKLYIPDYISIKGTIDGKAYELNLPNAKVPRDSDTKDIVSLILFDEGYHPAVINGDIVALRPDKTRIGRWKRGINKQEDFFKENVKPLITQTVSTFLAAYLAVLMAKIGLKK